MNETVKATVAIAFRVPGIIELLKPRNKKPKCPRIMGSLRHLRAIQPFRLVRAIKAPNGLRNAQEPEP